jgi:hypothetical protein
MVLTASKGFLKYLSWRTHVDHGVSKLEVY